MITSNLTKTNQPQRHAMIDVIRVILSFIILTHHVWGPCFNAIHQPNPVSPGYLVVEAFFMISGFFLVKSALKPNATTCWRYTWRRIWDYLPLLCIILIGSIIVFAITSLVYLEPFYWAFDAVWTWFIWALFFCGLVLFAVWKKAGKKFVWFALFIGIACYVALYFINPYISHNLRRDNIFEQTALVVACDLLRGFGGMLLGGFIFCFLSFFKENKNNKILTFIATLQGGAAAVVGLFYMYAYSNTPYDFLVVGMIFIMLISVFSERGILTQKIILPAETSKKISRFSYVMYLQQWLIIYFFQIYWQHNPHFWFETWWIVLYGVLAYTLSIFLTIFIMYLDKKVKQTIMVKFKKLNNL